jgi:predicted esterase YcpF (UPF0227 family)
MDKKIIMLAMLVGSTVGGYIPTWFGASAFGLASVLCGAVGGLLGIWVAFRWLD